MLAALMLLVMHGSGAAQGAPARWRLSPHPSVTIGRQGGEHTEFLRIGGVLRLPGGEIVVPNGASREIRIFDRAGRYLRALGRAGAGPGEFTSLDRLGRVGDTLFIVDGSNARITMFLVGGRLVKTIPITARDSAGRFSVVGRLRNGRWLVSTTSSPNIRGPQRTYRDTAHTGTIAPDASGPVSWLTASPGQTFFVYNPANGARGEVVGVVPLAPTKLSVVSGDEVLIGDTGENVIGAYSADGAVLRLIVLPLEALPLTDDRLAQLRKHAFDRNPSERARPYLTALHSRSVMGRTLPVFGDLLPAADGSLWVQQGPRDSAEPATWFVLDAGGTPKASLLVPGGFRITDVGARYVLGVHTGADGVETVRLYQLTPQ